MNKKKKSILNAVSAFIQTIFTSLINLVLAREILTTFGSDYNGINSTISQIISTLLILEGGFTLATNVALFSPFAQKEYSKINGILSATKNRFLRIGSVIFACGVLVAFIYPFTVTTSMPYWTMVALTFTVLVPASINIGISMKYRVVILAEQKEYIITMLNFITSTIGTILSIVAIKLGFNIVIVRSVHMVTTLICYALIIYYCKKNYPLINFKEKPLYSEIKGTKDVIALKLTSLFYTTIPVIVISTIPGKGTLLASVYSVYKSITIMIRNTMTAVINAPRLSFGVLMAEGRLKEAEKMFSIYELIACLANNIIIGTTCVLILPFIKIYTNGVSDISYNNPLLSIIMTATVLIEIIHIPSGQIIQMAGKFAVSKKIQLTACIALLITMVVGKYFWGMFGVALSTLVAAIVLAILEMFYTRAKIFKSSFKKMWCTVLPTISIYIVSAFIGVSQIIKCNNFFEFVFWGIVIVVALTIVSFVLYWITNREVLKATIGIFKGLLQRNKKD